MAKKTNVIEQMEMTARAALTAVHEALTSEKPLEKKALLAMNFLNHTVKREALGQSQSKLQWAVAKHLVDKKEMAKYCKASGTVVKKILTP